MHKIFPSALLLALVSLTSAANASDLSVTTTSLPNGVVGAPYTASIAASGGTQPYTWSNVFLGCPTPPCGLPPGLTATFSSTSVSISGVPTMAGGFFAIYRVADSSVPPQTASRSFWIAIDPSSTSLRIVTTSLPSGTVGVSYSATIDAAGGKPPYTWGQEALPCAVVLLCEVPPGLRVAFSSTNVSISGVPTQAGDFIVAYRVTDSSSPQQTAMQTFTISIAPVSSILTITTTSLPDGAVGASYSASIKASGGTPPYTWTNIGLACPAVTCGLPPGLMAGFTSTSVSISGTPTLAGQFMVAYSVSDSGSPKQTATRTFTISIAPSSTSLAITTTSLPNGSLGVTYSAVIDAAGGHPPYTWTQELLPCVIAGAVLCEVPPGLRVTFSSTSVSIAGVPTQAGAFLVGYSVTDSSSPRETASRTFNISIGTASPALTIATTSLPNGAVGASYAASVSASGGTTPYTWSQVTTIACPAIAGVYCSLPPGLTVTLGATASISGSPTRAGQYFVEFRVTDSSSPPQTAMRIFTISITAPGGCVFSITPTSETVGNGSGGVTSPSGSFALTATHCTASDTWRAVSDSRRLKIAPPAGGNGSVTSQTIQFTMLTNSSSQQRTAHVIVSGVASGQLYSLTFTAIQNGSTEPLLPRAVRALYQSILGREPDQAGFEFWTGNGAPADSSGAILVNGMADDFYRSPEFRDTGFAALAIYQAVTGQLPGFDQWSSAVDQLRGDPLAVGQLTDSLSGSMSDAAFVQQTFLNAYGRPASASELAGFTGQLSGGMSRYALLSDVVFQSGEFQSRTNAAFVNMLYYTILERDPDTGGFQFWLNQIPVSAGTPGVYYVYLSPPADYSVKLSIIGQAAPPNPAFLGFLGSPEFQALIE